MAAVKWNGPQLQALIDAEMRRRLDAAGYVVENHAKQLVNIDGTGGSGGRKLSYGTSPSAPGDPPHKQRGRLIGSITHEVSGLVCRVGTNVIYGRWLELGTTRMAARPWLRRALAERYAAVARLLGARMF